MKRPMGLILAVLLFLTMGASLCYGIDESATLAVRVICSPKNLAKLIDRGAKLELWTYTASADAALQQDGNKGSDTPGVNKIIYQTLRGPGKDIFNKLPAGYKYSVTINAKMNPGAWLSVVYVKGSLKKGYQIANIDLATVSPETLKLIGLDPE